MLEAHCWFSAPKDKQRKRLCRANEMKRAAPHLLFCACFSSCSPQLCRAVNGSCQQQAVRAHQSYLAGVQRKASLQGCSHAALWALLISVLCHRIVLPVLRLGFKVLFSNVFSSPIVYISQCAKRLRQKNFPLRASTACGCRVRIGTDCLH